MKKNWKDIVISPDVSVRMALDVIDKGALRIAIVANEHGKLLGVVTDGDVRRGILRGISLDAFVSNVMNCFPFKASLYDSIETLKSKIDTDHILAIPQVDDNNIIQGLITLYDKNPVPEKESPVFIMAGGFGTRLRPLTDKCPKPMLNVGGKPMLETLILNFKRHGFTKFYISTHYMPEVIRNYFGNGRDLEVDIKYVHEEEPLGTGGALSLLPKPLPNEPVIMINGDILTTVNLSKVLDFHKKSGSDATMCVRDYEVKVPFGVIEGKGPDIEDIVEKPTYRYFVNAGIYVLSREVIESVREGVYLDMPTLFESAKSDGYKTKKFPIHEYWLDIGRLDDFYRAQEDIKDLDLWG